MPFVYHTGAAFGTGAYGMHDKHRQQWGTNQHNNCTSCSHSSQKSAYHERSEAAKAKYEAEKHQEKDRAAFLEQEVHAVLLQHNETTLNLSVQPLHHDRQHTACVKGVLYELNNKRQGGSKWLSCKPLDKWSHLFTVTNLKPGLVYEVRTRLGLSGAFSWTGQPEWRAWSVTQSFTTSKQVVRNNKQHCTQPTAPADDEEDKDSIKDSVRDRQQRDGKVQETEQDGREEAKATRSHHKAGGKFHCHTCNVNCQSWHALQMHMSGRVHEVHVGVGSMSRT